MCLYDQAGRIEDMIGRWEVKQVCACDTHCSDMGQIRESWIASANTGMFHTYYRNNTALWFLYSS